MRTSTSLLFLLWALTVSYAGFSQAVVRDWSTFYATEQQEYPIAVKTQGTNVYVLGRLTDASPGHSSDIILLKYSSGAQIQWFQIYADPSGESDEPRALTVDAAGNAYITGFSYVRIGSTLTSKTITIKYDAAGELKWVSSFFRDTDLFPSEGTSVAVDAAGNVYMAGNTLTDAFQYDYLTIKYNSDGQQQWFRTYDGGTLQIDDTRGLSIDRAGNAIVTGFSFVRHKAEKPVSRYPLPTQSFDIVTFKYDPNGNVLWKRTYNGPKNTDDRPVALTTDASNNVYIGGNTSGDILALKYDAAGTQQWVARYNSPVNLSDGATDMAVDGSGNVFLTGYTQVAASPQTARDYLTVKFNSLGALQWARTYNGPGNGLDQASSMALDGFGALYVTGQSEAVGYDFATIKYSNSGVQIWVARFDGPDEHSSDNAVDIATYTSPGPEFEDASIYVTGYTGFPDQDIVTVKYLQPIETAPVVNPRSAPTEITGEFRIANYPNPFNYGTRIEYSLPHASYVTIKVYDVAGKELTTVVNGQKPAGTHREFIGAGFSTGTYLYRVVTTSPKGRIEKTGTMIKN